MGYLVVNGAIDLDRRIPDRSLRAIEAAHAVHLAGEERYYRLIWLFARGASERNVVSTHVTLSTPVAFRYEATEVPELDDDLASSLFNTLKETGVLDLRFVP